MDLTSLKPTGRSIEIMHPVTEKPIGIRVGILPMEDPKLKELERQITDERMRLSQRGKAFKSAEMEKNYYMLLWHATTGWEWYNPTGEEGDDDYDADAMPDFEGEVPEYNQKNFMAVVKQLEWFGNQINTEIGDTKAFFSNSESN